MKIHTHTTTRRNNPITRLALAATLALACGLSAAASDGGPGGCISASADPEQGGAITVSVADPCPAAGTAVTFSAAAAPGFTFAFWSEAASGTDPTVTLTVGNSSGGDSGNELQVEAHFADANGNFDDSAHLDGLSDGEDVSGDVEIHLAETHAGDLAQSDFYLDGTLKKSDTQAPFDFSFDSRSLDNGSHRLDVSTRDSSGRTATKTVEFTAAAGPVINWVRVTDEMNVTMVKVGGSGFGAGSQILVNGSALNKTRYNTKKAVLVSTGGKKMHERFTGTVCVTVKNATGLESPCYNFTKP